MENWNAQRWQHTSFDDLIDRSSKQRTVADSGEERRTKFEAELGRRLSGYSAQPNKQKKMALKKATGNTQVVKKRDATFDAVHTQVVVSDIKETYQIYSYKYDDGRESFRKELDKREVLSKMVIQMKEASPEEIMRDYREKNLPILVVKYYLTVYVAVIPKETDFGTLQLFGQHKCTINTKECDRLSAAPDPKGCAKVRNRSRYLENYPWILKGYETANTVNDAFSVGICENYFHDYDADKKRTNGYEARDDETGARKNAQKAKAKAKAYAQKRTSSGCVFG